MTRMLSQRWSCQCNLLRSLSQHSFKVAHSPGNFVSGAHFASGVHRSVDQKSQLECETRLGKYYKQQSSSRHSAFIPSAQSREGTVLATAVQEGNRSLERGQRSNGSERAHSQASSARPRKGASYSRGKQVSQADAPRQGRKQQSKSSKDQDHEIGYLHQEGQVQPMAVLQPGKARLFYNGAPTVYKGNLDRIIAARRPLSGDAVLLTDHNLAVIGWGVYNSTSMYAVRILQWANEMESKSNFANMADLIEERLIQAQQLRQSLVINSTETSAYRLVNSEGDRLPGMTVDVFNTRAVVASSAAWIEQNRDIIESCIKKIVGITSVIWRRSDSLLALEGFVATDSSDDGAQGLSSEDSSASSSFETITESGVVYKVDLVHGQKTGFYADQRDSRNLISSVSSDKTVLDLCCYTGGFALSAAHGRAHSVTGIDSAKSAIALAKENAELNGFQSIEFEATDIESYMKSAQQRGQQWDVVILDPPKLAPKKSALVRASRKYVSLNVAALRLVKSGGLFMTCSCSGAIAQGDGLSPLVQEAAGITGRRFSLLRSAGAALDHPLDPAYPEGQYLTNLLYRVI